MHVCDERHKHLFFGTPLESLPVSFSGAFFAYQPPRLVERRPLCSYQVSPFFDSPEAMLTKIVSSEELSRIKPGKLTRSLWCPLTTVGSWCSRGVYPKRAPGNCVQSVGRWNRSFIRLLIPGCLDSTGTKTSVQH